jgi:hypothetical protein
MRVARLYRAADEAITLVACTRVHVDTRRRRRRRHARRAAVQATRFRLERTSPAGWQLILARGSARPASVNVAADRAGVALTGKLSGVASRCRGIDPGSHPHRRKRSKALCP